MVTWILKSQDITEIRMKSSGVSCAGEQVTTMLSRLFSILNVHTSMAAKLVICLTNMLLNFQLCETDALGGY